MKSHPGSQAALSLLIVEDDGNAMGFLSRLIAKRWPDCAILEAENGQKGLGLFKEHRPDIVITDINMPVMDGIEMAGKIKALDRGAHIIAITAKSDTQHLLDAIKIGVNRYVLKPVDIDKLFESINDCVARITLDRQIKERDNFILKLSRAVEQSSNMILIADARGVVEYVNPMFTGVTGYAPQEVTGLNLRFLMANSAPHDAFEMLWSRINRGLEWRGEFVNRKKNGDCFCAEASISSVASEEGYTSHFVAVLQDISERKRAEEQIRRLNDELERRVKERTAELEASNKELESFCYSVSHDLRSPLRSMGGFSMILQQDYSDQLDESGKGYLQRIQTAARNMGQLIDDLLNLSRVTRTPLCREKIDLTALAVKISTRLVELEPERLVEVVIGDGVEAYGDPNLIRLALDNLLSNAWKYTGKEPRPRIEFDTRVLNGETVFFVRDNGVGFDLAHASLLFKPFHRLHGAGEFTGNGIGLATVERIIARHGGRIWAEAEAGKGANFFFTLGG